MALIDLVNHNFSILNDLTQMVNFPWITDCPTFLVHFFLLTLVFVLQMFLFYNVLTFPSFGNSDHVFVSVSIDFPANSKRDAPFHRIAYDCSRADWDGLHNRLRDIPWENIFKLGAFAAASEF